MSAASASRPVRAGDRVNDVLARDEALVEVFVRHSKHFIKLRNRTMRRIMARLVTVQDASRMAAVPLDTLLRELNDALGISSTRDAVPANSSSARDESGAVNTPGGRSNTDSLTSSPMSHPASAHVVEVDVREELRQGREPLARIMAAVNALRDDDVLQVRAIFEPVPLFTLLAKRGFAHESAQHAVDDWSVWFWRDAASRVATISSAPSDSSADPSDARGPAASDPTITWLDVRGLEPPEPLMRTLAALETLPAGHRLVHVNSRVPQLLLPMLAERGFACELDESHTDQVLLRIWRPS